MGQAKLNAVLLRIHTVICIKSIKTSVGTTNTKFRRDVIQGEGKV